MEPCINIQVTIQTAIDRAAEAWQEVEGTDIDQEINTTRWQTYHAMLDDMGRNWSDLYPLAPELATLSWTGLRDLWQRLTK